LSVEAGKLDITDRQKVGNFKADFSALVHNIIRHHELEGQFIHPLLTDKVPGGAEKLEEEHRVAAHMMDNLVKYLDEIIAQLSDYSNIKELGLEFYLAYNRFMIYFMAHLNEEEQHIQRTLWHLCKPEEVAAAVGKLQANQEPELAMENIEMIITSVSLFELTEILRQSMPNAPPEAFKRVLTMAERDLGAQEYTKLLSNIGV